MKKDEHLREIWDTFTTQTYIMRIPGEEKAEKYSKK